MEILRCENVRKVYGSGSNQVVALDHIDLSVQKGEFVAIVGASGSGKSTLLHILGSVDRPTEGTVLIEGVDISAMNRTQAAVFRRSCWTRESQIRTTSIRSYSLWGSKTSWRRSPVSCQADNNSERLLPGHSSIAPP